MSSVYRDWILRESAAPGLSSLSQKISAVRIHYNRGAAQVIKTKCLHVLSLIFRLDLSNREIYLQSKFFIYLPCLCEPTQILDLSCHAAPQSRSDQFVSEWTILARAVPCPTTTGVKWS